ncbi:unnamed protein product, partial [Ectocarpus sp. 4 AP-2014]
MCMVSLLAEAYSGACALSCRMTLQHSHHPSPKEMLHLACSPGSEESQYRRCLGRCRGNLPIYYQVLADFHSFRSFPRRVRIIIVLLQAFRVCRVRACGCRLANCQQVPFLIAAVAHYSC